MFTIEPFLPIENNDYTCLKVACLDDDVTQADIDELRIPKYVGTLRPRWVLTIDLTPNKSTGEINERGIKRITAFLKAAKGHYEVRMSCLNSASIEDFCKYHGIEI